MKKLVILVALSATIQFAFAGGVVTNSNQSAQFIRSMARNASTEIDAVYYNPAGLANLADGWHFALYNQTIMQEKKVNNTFPLLGTKEFIGKVNAPVFPNFYAAYKRNEWTVALGFAPVGGGGSADFDKGLPAFEMPISGLPAAVSKLGIPTTGYKADIAFKGSSVYYGVQLDVAYKLSDVTSIAFGGRFVSAVNTYEGSIKGIQINPTFPALGLNGNYIPATAFFQQLAAVNPAAAAYAAQVADKKVDAKQTANGFAPILGANVKATDKLNVAVRYEFATPLEFTNDTKVDDAGLFPDKAKSRNDLPALLALGAQYEVFKSLRAALAVNYYYDQETNWNGREKLMKDNTYEVALGLEFDVTKCLLVSAGYNRTQSGVSEAYQTDISHHLSSNTVGVGLRYLLFNKLALDLGAAYSLYDEMSRKGAYAGVPFVETYNRNNIAVAVGLGYHF
ncbi:MAG: hypothetical protein ONA69_10365 [candidate division KSB1 bacterium]|nr:hypothetical protein [candidate division KSB1 bacterium]MDZ7347182.1 hypothetical protein [candidate division KSB1 bacterium]